MVLHNRVNKVIIMDITAFFTSDIFTLAVIPLLIFLSRIVDVSIGTIRVIFISKGYKYIAPLLGFIEVVVWLIAIKEIMNNLNGVVGYIAYGLGFATGTYVGMILEDRLSVGKVVLRIITQSDSENLVTTLRESNHIVTTIDAKGSSGDVNIIFMIINRDRVKSIVKTVNKFNPKAFYSIEDVRFAVENQKSEKKYKNIL